MKLTFKQWKQIEAQQEIYQFATNIVYLIF